MREGGNIQPDSSALWNQLRGKIDRSFQQVLNQLDEQQHNEDISPFLAETVRDMVFQLTEEDPKRAQQLAISCVGFGPKYMTSLLEDDGGNYRLRKSAELVAEKSGGMVKVGDILLEYNEWQHSE